MANTFEAIQTVTATSGAQTYLEFTSIPQTYTDLYVYYASRTSTNTNYDSGIISLIVNGNTSAKFQMIESYGSVTDTARYTPYTPFSLGIGGGGSTELSGVYSVGYCYLLNYSTTGIKLAFSHGGFITTTAGRMYHASQGGQVDSANTNAITSISIQRNSSQHAQYSTATLYGIKNS